MPRSDPCQLDGEFMAQQDDILPEAERSRGLPVHTLVPRHRENKTERR